MRHKIACKRTRRRRKSRGGPYTAKPILTLDQSSSSDHGEATVFDDARKGASLHYDVQVRFGTGCLICKKEDNEDKILLCETCEGEYHTYCLQPALPLVPEGDWFCGT